MEDQNFSCDYYGANYDNRVKPNKSIPVMLVNDHVREVILGSKERIEAELMNVIYQFRKDTMRSIEKKFTQIKDLQEEVFNLKQYLKKVVEVNRLKEEKTRIDLKSKNNKESLNEIRDSIIDTLGK